MSAQIINLQAWRVAHSERPALCLELLRAHPEGGSARGTAGQDHHTASGRSPSRRTQPSKLAPTFSAMKGA